MAERLLGSFDSLWLLGVGARPSPLPISYLWLPIIFNFDFLILHRLYVLFRPDNLLIWFGLKNTSFFFCERLNTMALFKKNKKINWPQKKKNLIHGKSEASILFDFFSFR